MRVLIYTATYGGLLRRETIDGVWAQRCDGRYDYEIGYHNPYGEGDLRNVTAQMERGRQMALDGGHDALLAVEHDMMIPPDALQRLWDTDAPVVYGVYVFRHAYRFLNTYEKMPAGANGIGESLTLHPKKLALALKQNPVEVSGVGFGCTLIRRAVLERIAFRHRDSDRNGTDTQFGTDCVHAGIRQMARWDVPCGHWNGKRWLMPFDPIDGETVRVRALQNVTVRIGIESVRLTLGQDYEVPFEEVHDLIRAGWVSNQEVAV